MLHQPLTPSDEQNYREKLAQWYPHDALQDGRLAKLTAFLESDKATTEIREIMRTLVQFCLEQAITAREVSDHERAAGREDFLLSPSHPLMRQLLGGTGKGVMESDTMNSVVDHLRQADLQRRMHELRALLMDEKVAIPE